MKPLYQIGSLPLLAGLTAVGISLFSVSSALASTEESIHKDFAVKPGGHLVVDVEWGAILVSTNGKSAVIVDAERKIGRSSEKDELAYLNENPIQFSQSGDTLTITCRRKSNSNSNWNLFGKNKNEGTYTISVPAEFSAQLNTAGGRIQVEDLHGKVVANTSGGSLKFGRLNGPLDGNTSGGGIHLADCQGKIKIKTSGGGIEVNGGSGSLDGSTSGGSVTVKRFEGATRVATSGGGITLTDVVGMVDGQTSGGSINAQLPTAVKESVRLSTSGGGVTLRLPENSAFDLDAETSAGGVHCDLPIAHSGKPSNHLKGPVNGGGKSVSLRSSAGSIRVLKLAKAETAENPAK
jgi:DUF4097 and DUF4098 domain-containing protein YvlB